MSDADDLVARLTAASHDERLSTGMLYREAAAAIEALQQRIDGPADDPYAALKAEIRRSLSPPADDLVSRLRACENRVVDGRWQSFLDEAAHALERSASDLCSARAARDEATQLLRDWCRQVDQVGTGWDDWDHCYKTASAWLRRTGWDE